MAGASRRWLDYRPTWGLKKGDGLSPSEQGSGNPILIVEDDDDIREDLAELLREEGYRVLTAANGLQAMDRLRESARPSLILLDLMMPVMDGWTLRQELLKRPEWASVPVVVLSGTMDLPREAKSMGATSYLQKPFGLESLMSVLKAHC